MKKKVILFLSIMFLAFSSAFYAQSTSMQNSDGQNVVLSENSGSEEQKKLDQKEQEQKSPWKYFAAALAVGVACIGGGLAVGKIGSAAMGAMSENASLSGKALPFVGLAEGICLWGFLVGLLIIIL